MDDDPAAPPKMPTMRFVRGSQAFSTLPQHTAEERGEERRDTAPLAAAQAYREALQSRFGDDDKAEKADPSGRHALRSDSDSEKRDAQEKRAREGERRRRQRRRLPTAKAHSLVHALFKAAESEDLKALTSALDGAMANDLSAVRDAHGWSLLGAAAAVGAHSSAALLVFAGLYHTAQRTGGVKGHVALQRDIEAAVDIAGRAEADELAAALRAVAAALPAANPAEHTPAAAAADAADADADAADADADAASPRPQPAGAAAFASPAEARARQHVMQAVCSSISAASAARWRSGLQHAVDSALIPALQPPPSQPARSILKGRAPQPGGSSQWRCEVCSMDVHGPPAAHQASVAHRLRLAEAAGPSAPVAGRGVTLTAKNRGYQLLKQAGWDEKSGLGPKGEGRVQPVRTQLKRDRKGLGANDAAAGAGGATAHRDLWRALDAPPPKLVAAGRSVKRPALDGRARVSHFGPYDTRAVDAPYQTHRAAAEAGQPVSRRAQLAAFEKDKANEMKLRELFRDDF